MESARPSPLVVQRLVTAKWVTKKTTEGMPPPQISLPCLRVDGFGCKCLGQDYYFNEDTQETTWAKPPELGGQLSQAGEWVWLPDEEKGPMKAKKVPGNDAAGKVRLITGTHLQYLSCITLVLQAKLQLEDGSLVLVDTKQVSNYCWHTLFPPKLQVLRKT